MLPALRPPRSSHKADNVSNPLKIPFPLKGLDENWAVSGQPPLTSPDLQNVRPRDVQDKRSRGGQRPAVRKIMYWWDYPGEGGDLGLPVPSPIIGLTQVTAVYYASVAGDSGVSYIDPTGGDPRWDGVVLYSTSDFNHEVQTYSFTGNSLFEIDINNSSAYGYLALDKVGYIYLADDVGYKKYDRDGNKLTSTNIGGTNYGIWVSIKKDNIIFAANNETLSAFFADDFVTSTGISRDFNQGIIYEVVQLENSDDLLVALYDTAKRSVERVSRVDLSFILAYETMGMGDGARSIAVDEANDFLYTVKLDKVHRFKLSDASGKTDFQIPGADLQRVRIYDGKIYVCGDRATDNNSVWKLDAGITGIEADYDTGDDVKDMRIAANGTIYVVGVSAQNEDTETGNVNVLNSNLVRSGTWNVRAGKTIHSIAEKYG